MKTRTGFVSNSSSSSYVLIIPEEAYIDVFSDLDPGAQEVIDYISQPDNILGQACMVTTWWSGNIDTFEDFVSSKLDNKNQIYEILSNFRKEVLKYSGTWLRSNSDS